MTTLICKVSRSLGRFVRQNRNHPNGVGLIRDATPKETIDFLEHEVQMIIAYIAIAVL